MSDLQRYHKEADRVFRAQGNRSGRLRMRADGSLRPAKPPRGMLLATGEDVPRGQSLNARLLTLELTRNDTELASLSACQRDGAAGAFASALSGFIRWLAPQYEDMRRRLRAEVAALRDKAADKGQHARTPGIVADLALGLKYLFSFALEVGSVTEQEIKVLKERAWAALLEAGAGQADHVRAADPVDHFLRLIAGVLASGRGHIAASTGAEPAEATAWGWRMETFGAGDRAGLNWRAQGKRLGWVDGSDLYLEPEAVFAEAQEMARNQAESVPITPRTLWKRMREKKLLSSWDQVRQRNTVRRDLEGVRQREVLHLSACVLQGAKPSTSSIPSSNGQAHVGSSYGQNGTEDGYCGRFAGQEGCSGKQPSTETVHKTSGNGNVPPSSGRCGQFHSGKEDTRGGIGIRPLDDSEVF